MVKKLVADDSITLQKLRLQLVKENPIVFGETFESESEFMLQDYKNWIKKRSVKDSGIFVIFLDGKAIGMCEVRPDKENDVGYFGSLGILREYQGKGFGSMLMDFRLEWAKKNTNFKKIKTIITKNNKRMLVIAQKQGFKIVGEGNYKSEPEYYLERELG